MKKDPADPTSNHNDDSAVLWVLTFIFITLTSLTVNAYSDLENDPTQQAVVNHQTPQISQQTSDLQLINAKSDSQSASKTLNM